MTKNCLDCVNLTILGNDNFQCDLGAFGPTSGIEGEKHGLGFERIPSDYIHYKCPLTIGDKHE